MLTFERLFVPVDFSESSRAALSLATTINPSTAEIHCAHVIEPWLPYVREVLFPYAAMGEDEVEFEDELRTRALKLVASHYKLSQHTQCQPPEVYLGKAYEHLRHALQKTNSDLVVLGAFGQGGARPDSLGTTTSLMLRQAIEPMLLVRKHTPSPSIKHILCAIDMSAQSSAVLEAAMSLALTTNATLETAYVLPDPLRHDTNNILRSQLKFDSKQILDRSKDKLEALFERTYNGIDIPFPVQNKAQALWSRRVILFGDPSREIIQRADTTDADVIVVGSRNIQNTPGPQFGQVCWSITRRSTSHVMVVPIEQNSSILDNSD